MRRVEAELERQRISRAALARRAGAPSQTTLNDVLNGADPTLETVSKIATALGVMPWQLLVEQQTAPQQEKVHRLPSPYSPVFPSESTQKPLRRRKA